MRRNVYSTCDSQLPNGKKFVAVNLLSEDTLYFVVEVKSIVSELFAQVSKFLGLYETELFGLAIKTDSYLFLDPNQKLCKYAPKQWKIQNNGVDSTGKSLFGVHLRVQFYVDSYLFISDKVAKLLYYLQLRENVANYGQALCEERAFLLASYALQADFGNFNSEVHVGHYFNAQLYFASWVIETMGLDYIVKHLPYLHREHKGMPKSEAQCMYIKEASDASAPHNLHLYKLKNKTATNEVWLGICTTGVEINSEEQRISSIHTNSHSSHTCATQKSRISFFAWSDIGKLYFEKKKFEIRSTGYPIRKFTYYANTEDMARHLLWLCKVSHQFQLVVQSKMKEVKRRESELCRKKFRESYIYDQSYDLPIIGRNNKKGSEFSKSTTSVLEETSAQRVSVISNASSNTTSGIVSDKVQSLEDSDRDDIDIEIMINSAPVVSLESLALSEPIDNLVRRAEANVDEKQSNSISNITMICNSYPKNKQQSDNDVPSSVNSIKSTSSDQSNTTVKSVVPVVAPDVPLVAPLGATKQIIDIINQTNDNNDTKHLNESFDETDSQSSGILINSSTSSTSPEPQHSTPVYNSCAKVPQQPDLSIRSVNFSKLVERSESMNHIYENIPYFSHFQTQQIKPKLVLKACPSLSSTLTPTTTTTPTQRTATRIGVSSLTRTHNKPTLSVFSQDPNSAKNLSIAASEPNLHTSPIWSSPSSLPNRTIVKLNDESNQHQLSPNAQNNGFNEMSANSRTNPPSPPLLIMPSKEARAYSDPIGHYSRPPIQTMQTFGPTPYSMTLSTPKRVVDCPQPAVQPSFHQSLNNIAMTSAHPLRLVESDISVNTESNLQSVLIPPPPPQYATPSNGYRVIKSANISQITSQKANTLMNGRLNGKTYNEDQNGSISDLQQLRQKSRDLNLPLITALFNDRSLMMLPKTVPGSRQRHISTARDIRRYSCSSDICADIPYKHISTMPLRKLDTTDLTLSKVTLSNRPTSWHLEYPNLQHKYVWEQYQRSQAKEFRSTTADFIERLWAEHQLTT